MSVEVQNNTPQPTPPVAFDEIKNKVLGSDYELSLVFVTAEEIQKLNDQYRKKDYPTDILSFSLTENSGEIFICQTEADAKAPLHNKTSENYMGFLFIHGLLHLKGLDHGSKMEAEEKALCQFFGIENK